MLNPPCQMQVQTESLAVMIRLPNEQNVLCRYSEFIRDNVFGVVSNTFPLFCDLFSCIQLERMIDVFVAKHDAFEAEFHQIATEFVQFLQKDQSNDTYFVSQQQLALLEYEWVMFCVEIDTIYDSLPSFSMQDLAGNHQFHVTSTLKLTQVPFLFHRDSVTFLTSDRHSVFYGVFRNKDHQVVSQRLRNVDIALIQLLVDQPGLTSAQLQQAVDQQNISFSVMGWAQHFSELGLLKVQLSGE
ncbi:putative DNA-binding domain-containing protein [Vibrio pectenicida]|uniref:HvfC/BufC family peptide modification chaperone n=1 Tax=Vibrio pectenicida TaxID=62763 RepID=UPI003B9BFF3E